jgi:hypothetical protein
MSASECAVSWRSTNGRDAQGIVWIADALRRVVRPGLQAEDFTTPLAQLHQRVACPSANEVIILFANIRGRSYNLRGANN